MNSFSSDSICLVRTATDQKVRNIRRKIMNENKGTSLLKALGRGFCSLVKKSMENYLVVSHEGVVKFRISIFVFVILFLIFHAALFVAMVVSLFFGVRYGFAGKEDMSGVNRVLDHAGERATEWRGSFRYSDQEVNALCKKYDNDDRQ